MIAHRLRGSAPVIQWLCWRAAERGEIWRYIAYPGGDAALFAPVQSRTSTYRVMAQRFHLTYSITDMPEEQIVSAFGLRMLTEIFQPPSSIIRVQPAQTCPYHFAQYDRIGVTRRYVFFDTPDAEIAHTLARHDWSDVHVTSHPQTHIVYALLTNHRLQQLKRIRGFYIRPAAGIPQECIPYHDYNT